MIPASVLDCPGLSAYERRIAEMRIRDGLRPSVIARRLGINAKAVYSALNAAMARADGRRKAAGRTPKTRPMVMDAGWMARNVAMYRAAERPQNYLNGVAIVWGQEWADRVEREAGDV